MVEKQIVRKLGQKPKILIIRLSSIGDIIQCMSVTEGIKNSFPESEIHWMVRQDMQKILQADSQIDRILVFDRKKGLAGLLKFAWQLRKESYDLVYDAHYNIRSRIVKSVLTPVWKQWTGNKPLLLVRKKQRIRRLLYFKFGMKRALDIPFYAIRSFQKPLAQFGFVFSEKNVNKWKFPAALSASVQTRFLGQVPNNKPWVTLVPSAAHEMKRWPVAYFRQLINLLPNYYFVILGGPQDQFCAEIANAAPERSLNLAGKTSLIESFFVVSESLFVVSADTGFLHAADLFRRPSTALLGPTAFGYPSHPEIKVLKANLPCMPCSKDGSGTCKQEKHKLCMYSIKPEEVALEITKTLG